MDDFNDSLLFENVALQIHLNAGTKSSSNLLAKPIFIKKYGDALQLSYEFTVGSGEGKQAGKQRLLFVDANATGLDQHDGGSKRKAAQQFFMTFPALIEIVD